MSHHVVQGREYLFVSEVSGGAKKNKGIGVKIRDGRLFHLHRNR
jgi:hypothetical protein